MLSELQITKGSFPKLNEKAIERAISSFVQAIDVHGDPIGFHNQTIKTVYHSVMGEGGDFWLAHEDGEVVAYVIGRTIVDIDDRLTYWLSQAYVAPKYRGKREIKEWWQKIRSHAKERLCKHIVVVSGRGVDAYCRFLGKGWHEYATLLKEDI